MRWCKGCQTSKDESEFYFKKSGNVYKGKRYEGYSHLCKICWNAERRQKYAELSSDAKKDRSKRQHLKASYGMTLEEYNEMFKKQDGRCAICNKHQSELEKPLFVDHDHQTGKTRKLLCQHCNSLLGFARDSVEALKAAIRYLRG